MKVFRIIGSLGLSGNRNDTAIQALFAAPYAPTDEPIAAALLAENRMPDAARTRVDARARELIEAIRNSRDTIGGVEDILHEYALSTREGVALMMLAEALLRVPDAGTADQLIEDKLDDGDWAGHQTKSATLLTSASAWALTIAARLATPNDTPQSVLAALTRRIGAPALRAATRQAIRVVGTHFVLGETIEDALEHTTSRDGLLYRYSFDMLGEGARTAADADRYYESYAGAIEAIGQTAGDGSLPNRPGISVKLSALHPRFEAISHKRVLAELTPRLLELARAAKKFDLNFTVDAEEADRLELSLDVIAAVLADATLDGWDGFGLAIQAYQKRAMAVIEHIDQLAQLYKRRLMIRLVKGAYWDTEIKRAQERGLPDYPVFTQKAMTDLNYMACVQQLLALRPRIYPQFATHNALTIATICEHAGELIGFEFQRLHGMGEPLYAKLLSEQPQLACRIYAPVGAHEDLLAYLVRRLLENGANSSFVARVANPTTPIDQLLQRPRDILATPALARHPNIPLPDAIFPGRKNSHGVEFGSRTALQDLQNEVLPFLDKQITASPLINCKAAKAISRDSHASEPHTCISPIDGSTIGEVYHSTPENIEDAFKSAVQACSGWSGTPGDQRARILERAADLIEEDRGQLLALLQLEGGKTLDDALSEVREAADFCRYYASQARETLTDKILPGPTGEENRMVYRGRGTFICISPWNFPLAIFTGQIAAALVSGNCVIAKPAEQTPLIALRAIEILHNAGVPTSVLHYLPGDGVIGSALVNDARTSGVAFTGSTQVAWLINRTLAAKDGPIAPLIAETGGINAMIVDATALPEQVIDDVIVSAFRSAGQRCSALRLLCLQEDIADKVLDMIIGAARELEIGDPREIDTHVGPVIDAQAQGRLLEYVNDEKIKKRILYSGNIPSDGTYFAPHIISLDSVRDLKDEIFGPVLHVVRWKSGSAGDPDRGDLKSLLEAIAANQYGLTLGIHSRIEDNVNFITAHSNAGNIYVNRSMIGAVVGSQPFGGNGLSGTGPKAGGPDYLTRFCSEQVISTNTAASGGNTSLMTME